jgi:hypothetical protein
MILQKELTNFLEEVYKKLDIPDDYYKKANRSYRAFTEWLNREDSLLKNYEPEIFIQGSFKIGTVIKPMGENGSYDIDIVCKLNNLSKEEISQKNLKELLGKEVKLYANSKNMINKPHDGKRCWTLKYHDEAKFHMDILVCLEDSVSFIRQLNEKNIFEINEYNDNAIAITDKNSDEYHKITDNWEISNPKGYFKWFREKSNFYNKKRLLAESMNMKIEELENYKVKTILQKVIQILKRHRDNFFENNIDYKPSSIIISTLAAKAYKGENELELALKNIIDDMNSYIKKIDNEYRILNPANPLENFAEKWNKNERLKNEFDNWIEILREIFVESGKNYSILGNEYVKGITESLSINNKDKFYNFNNIENFIKTIQHRQKPKWEMKDYVDVSIKATKTKKGFSMPRRFNSGDVLSKNSRLKFEAISENINKYSVYWQITNTGSEARQDECLRGDFYNGSIEEGKRIRKENTKYMGTHIVECYFVKDEICYGKSKPFIVNIKN